MIKDDDTPVVIAIKEILETRVRPLVQEDGGDIVYKEFDEAKGVLFNCERDVYRVIY